MHSRIRATLLVLLACGAGCLSSPAPAAAPTAAAAAAPAGLYGLSPNTSLLFISDDGSARAVGAALPARFAAGPALTALDARAATFFAVLFDLVAQHPFLVGISLANGSVTSSVRLPFTEDGFIGLGQVLALKTDPARPTVAIVGGQNAAQTHEFGTVDAVSGGDYRRFATLDSGYNDVGGCSAAYIPATDSLLVQFNRNVSSAPPQRRRGGGGGVTAAPLRDFEISVYSISLADGSARRMPESFANGTDIQALGGFDAATGHVFGLGVTIAGEDIQRQVVDLDPVALAVSVVGNVSVDTVLSDGVAAFNSQRRSLYWMGDRGGSDQYYLVQNSVAAGAAVLSHGSLCAYDECPSSLEYYPGSSLEGVNGGL